jgi:hypothetical protein
MVFVRRRMVISFSDRRKRRTRRSVSASTGLRMLMGERYHEATSIKSCYHAISEAILAIIR